jgi:hypothetical protein
MVTPMQASAAAVTMGKKISRKNSPIPSLGWPIRAVNGSTPGVLGVLPKLSGNPHFKVTSFEKNDASRGILRLRSLSMEVDDIGQR